MNWLKGRALHSRTKVGEMAGYAIKVLPIIINIKIRIPESPRRSVGMTKVERGGFGKQGKM
jgi:hypothetical protein